jgi:hypothetical protein
MRRVARKYNVKEMNHLFKKMPDGTSFRMSSGLTQRVAIFKNSKIIPAEVDSANRLFQKNIIF